MMMQTRMRWINEVMIKCLEWDDENNFPELIFDPEFPADLWCNIYDDKYKEGKRATAMNVCSLYVVVLMLVKENDVHDGEKMIR